MSVIGLPNRNLRVVDANGFEAFNRPWLLVHSIRTAFLVCILLVSVVYQINIGNFLNVEIWLPVYGVLLANFFLNSVYLFMFERLEKQAYWNGVLFGLDTLAVTLLIYFTVRDNLCFCFYIWST